MNIEDIKKFSIDKNGWSKVKFGDVAFEPKESVKDPLVEGIEHVVGLEHIDSEDIHLRRSAGIEDSTTFTKKFSKGDVLFGRRRAYLKKAAQAEFGGICSGDITVLRAKKNLLPELLPFIVNNEKFFDYAITHSAGGLSPRVKFQDLAKYEFLLPPKVQQAELAELLWAIDNLIQKELELFESLVNTFKSYRKGYIEKGKSLFKDNAKSFSFGKVCKDWPLKKLCDICQLIGGNAFKSDRFNEMGKFQVLRIGNITDSGFDLSKSPVFVNEITDSEKKFLIPQGAIVLSLTGTNGKRDYGFPSLMVEDKVHLLNQRLVMLLVDEKQMLPEFLYLLAKMELFQGRFFLNATGTANQANVSIQDISRITLPVPSLLEQAEIVEKTNSIRLVISDLKNINMSSRQLQNSLINQVF